jgi:hypothetical protein
LQAEGGREALTATDIFDESLEQRWYGEGNGAGRPTVGIHTVPASTHPDAATGLGGVDPDRNGPWENELDPDLTDPWPDFDAILDLPKINRKCRLSDQAMQRADGTGW